VIILEANLMILQVD